MKDLSVFKNLATGTDACRWCSHHCPDEDKYEILVTCIHIQTACLNINNTIHSILDGSASEMMNSIMRLLEKSAEYVQRNAGRNDKDASVLPQEPEKEWKLPGCSHIFQVAQSIDHLYLNEINNTD